MITLTILGSVGLSRPITAKLRVLWRPDTWRQLLINEDDTVIIETTGELLSRCLAKAPLVDKVYIVHQGYSCFVNSISLYSDNLFQLCLVRQFKLPLPRKISHGNCTIAHQLLERFPLLSR